MNHSHMAANYPKGREKDRVKVACLHDGKKIKYWSVQAEVIADIVRIQDMRALSFWNVNFCIKWAKIRHLPTGLPLKIFNKRSEWKQVFLRPIRNSL